MRPASSTDWSTPRSFSITSKSTVFEVPDNATLRARIQAKARPRSLPATTTPYSTWNTAKKTELDPYLSRLTNEVKLQMGALPDLLFILGRVLNRAGGRGDVLWQKGKTAA